jgi:hypothetical protein
MELFTQLFGSLLVFVYHCFDRIVIHGYQTAESMISFEQPLLVFVKSIVSMPAAMLIQC